MQTKAYLTIVILSTLAVGCIFAKPVETPNCPRGIPKVNCFLDPCAVSTCPGNPDAKCFADYCGGCNAVWWTSDNRRAQCDRKSKCPSNKGEVQCVKDPCQGQTCPAYPDARCVSNYCGGCNFDWFTPGGKKVDCKSTV